MAIIRNQFTRGFPQNRCLQPVGTSQAINNALLVNRTKMPAGAIIDPETNIPITDPSNGHILTEI